MFKIDSVLEGTTQYVRTTLEKQEGSHDWWHIWRVRNLALHIGQQEKADLLVVELAALLHDIKDWKYADGDHLAGPQVAREWLASQKVDPEITEHVCVIIEKLSYKGAGVDDSMPTLEGKVVQDADRIDAIGAIGIARTFAYGGSKEREIYNPEIKPELHASFEQYKNSTAPTINHFYEKLLLLKDRMKTSTGRVMAEERHTYMEAYLDRFFKEWDGVL